MLKLIYWVMFRIDLCYGLCLGYLKSSWFYADFNYILFVYHSRLVHGIENMRNPSKLVVSLEQLQQWHLFRAPTLFNRGCPQLSGALILSSTPATNPNFRAPTLTTWHVGPTSQWVIYPFLCSWCLSRTSAFLSRREGAKSWGGVRHGWAWGGASARTRTHAVSSSSQSMALRGEGHLSYGRRGTPKLCVTTSWFYRTRWAGTPPWRCEQIAA